jgi:glucose/mannose-6-phosphate isomerase
VIAGAGLTAELAYRWKTQINENAELPAFASSLPELNHNEIVGWGAAAELARFSAVFLEDADDHPRNVRRIELTAAAAAKSAAVVERVCAVGRTRTERVTSLVLLGDLMSLYLAVLRGIDPVSIHVLDELKADLAKP